MKVRRISPGTFLLCIGLAITLMGALTYFTQNTVVMSRLDTRQPGLYISLAGILLSILGFALEHRKGGVIWYKHLGVKVLPVSLVLTAMYVGITFFAFHQEEVQIRNGEVVLAGTLLVPKGEGPHPALVMMHGAGEATRMGMFAEAQTLARKGVAVLIYDKRGSGASVGGHYRFDGFEALASDGVAAIHFLRARNDIDPKQIGLWGTSEGGWTAPMAASQVKGLAFLIIVSGGPLTPEEQGAYSIANRLRLSGSSDQSIDEALELYAKRNAYVRTGLDNQLSERQKWWRDHMDTDVAPLLAAMDFPILFVLGANDPLIPASSVKAQVESVLDQVGHQDFAVEIFPEATHNLISAPTDCRLCIPDQVIGPLLPWFASGYLDLVSDWVTQRVQA